MNRYDGRREKSAPSTPLCVSHDPLVIAILVFLGFAWAVTSLAPVAILVAVSDP